jgi:methylglutaconyl-CoA hydratase
MSTLRITPGPVTTVTLNRPEVRNALNEEAIAELTAWAETVRPGGETRVAVLRAEGSAFSAGADIQWMARTGAFTEAENIEDATRAARMFLALDTLPVPLVAVVQGAALGGGAGLAAVSDLVIAADDAVFGFPETTLGIIPAVIAPYVVQKIGVSMARVLFLTAGRFSAAHAREIGLVHDVVPPAALDVTLERYLAEFVRTAPTAVAAAKQLIRDVHGRPPGDVLSLTAAALARQRASAEGREGLRAFLDKRSPSWSTR